ncbi:hypothetical protein LINPERHAP1_LOCUS36641 [Linum perenne]
MVHWDRWD